MMQPSSIIGYLWVILIAVWVMSAFAAKRTLRRRMGEWFWRAGIIVVIVVVLNRPDVQRSIARLQPHPSALLGYAAVALCALGIAFAVWARLYLGSNWGMPMSVKEHPELVTRGPYAYVRHPIYTGTLLAMFASALATGAWWLGVFAVSAVYFVYSATQEEKMMAQTFPDRYPAYKARTKMLIPFIF